MRTKIASGLMALSLVVPMFVFVAAPAQAASLTLSPWIYNPDDLCEGISSSVDGTGALTLNKPCPTSTNAAPGAEIFGVEGMSTTGMALSFDVDGYCGAGAPRFNVYLSDGSTIFLGCTYGNDSGNVTFEAGNSYGGVLFPEGGTIEGIDIVQDEEGSTTLSNISVDGAVVEPEVDHKVMKEQCKNGGWQTMTDHDGNSFKNQGQCVSHHAKMMVE